MYHSVFFNKQKIYFLSYELSTKLCIPYTHTSHIHIRFLFIPKTRYYLALNRFPNLQSIYTTKMKQNHNYPVSLQAFNISAHVSQFHKQE